MISAFSIYSMAICKTMNAEVFYRYGLHLIARCRHLTFLLNDFTKNPVWVLSTANIYFNQISIFCRFLAFTQNNVVFNASLLQKWDQLLFFKNHIIFRSPKWIVMERSGWIETTSHGNHQFPSQNARVSNSRKFLEPFSGKSDTEICCQIFPFVVSFNNTLWQPVASFSLNLQPW